jgi:hypothetical protein
MSGATLASTQARVRGLFTLETLVRPYTLLLIGGGLSFLAWAIPWGSVVPAGVLRGFANPQPWTLHGILFLAGWYAFFFVVALGGFRVGQRIPVFERAEHVSWESFYVYLTILSLVGTVYSYGYVYVKDPNAISGAFLHHRLNQVRYDLPYSAGVQTLRYAACLAGAIAIFELVRRRFRVLHVVNLLLLVLSAAIASRISLIIAAIVVLGLAARHLQTVHVPTRRILAVLLAGLAALLLALGLLNYSRNAGFYRLYGVRNPFVMNVDETVRYLSVPFQASVAVSNNASRWPEVPSTVASGAHVYLLPTYLTSGVPGPVNLASERYRSLVSISPLLSTNSVLAGMYGVFGLLVFPILGLVALVAAVIAGHASRYRSYVFLAGLVIAYCFAEWWRMYMFNQGIVQFLVLAVAFWGLVGSSADRWTGGLWSRLTRFLLPGASTASMDPNPSDNRARLRDTPPPHRF